MATVIVRDSARRDLVVCSEYFYEEVGNGLVMRFLNAAQESFVALTLMPRMGLPCGLRKAALRSLRRWPVKGFENWLFFYFPIVRGVEIVHVTHGARDIAALLDD